MCQGSAAQMQATICKGGTTSGELVDTKSSKGPRTHAEATTPVAGLEAIGREIAIFCKKLGEWPKGDVIKYIEDSRLHIIKAKEPHGDGDVGSLREVDLSRTRFQWTAPAPRTANPTYSSAHEGLAAVGCRVKCFWPGMAKWYQGKIQDYDAKSRQHTIKYRDGDIQLLTLRNEAIIYLDAPKDPKKVLANKAKAAKKEGEKPAKTENAAPTNGRPRGRPPTKKKSGGKRSREEDSEDGPKSKSNRSSTTRDDNAVGSPAHEPQKKKKSKTIRQPQATAGRADMDGQEGDDSDELLLDPGSDNDADSQDDVDASMDDDFFSEDELSEPDLDMASLDDGDSDFEVASARGRRGRGPGRPPGSSRKSKGLKKGCKRLGRPPGTSINKFGRMNPGRHAVSTSRPKIDDETVRLAGSLGVGSRVSVYWADDHACYKGRLTQFDSYHKRHKIVYDDGEEEWVALTRESFRWLTPRGRTAGCCSSVCDAMASLGAADMVNGPRHSLAFKHYCAGTPHPKHPTVSGQPSLDEEAVGWCVSLLCEADRHWYYGEVIGYDKTRDKHVILYEDGEDDWVAFSQEKLVWHEKKTKEVNPTYPGVQAGVEVPEGVSAIGWRVGVYWTQDMVFYLGEVTAFNEQEGQYEVAYDDGEEGTFSLALDKVKWLVPAGACAAPAHLRERRESDPIARRRWGTLDNDPDYEREKRRGPGRPRMVRQHAVQYQSGGGGGGGGGEYFDEGDLYEHGLRLRTGRAGGNCGAQGSSPIYGGDFLEGEPLLVRQMTAVPSFAGVDVQLERPFHVKIYLSEEAPDIIMGPALAKCQKSQDEKAQLKSRYSMLDHMGRRIARAQQSIVKGIPSRLPPLQQFLDNSGMYGTEARRAANYHRLSRPQGVPGSPFAQAPLQRRNRPSDESSEEEEEDEGELDRQERNEVRSSNGSSGAIGAVFLNKNTAQVNSLSLLLPSDDEDDDNMVLSPRGPAVPKGGKIKPKPLKDSRDPSPAGSDMIAPMVSEETPVMVSPFKACGMAGEESIRRVVCRQSAGAVSSEEANNAAGTNGGALEFPVGDSSCVEIAIVGEPMCRNPSTVSLLKRRESDQNLLFPQAGMADVVGFGDLDILQS